MFSDLRPNHLKYYAQDHITERITYQILDTRMERIRGTLQSDEVIERSDPSYRNESQVWSAHKDLNPQFVARPKGIESLSKLLKVLNDTDVEFNIRCGGCGSASSRGVLISMSAFNSFEFSKEEEHVIVGAGQLWRHIDAKVEEQAPGYSGKYFIS